MWQSIGPNLPTDSESATYDLAVDPQTPTTVYVGSRTGVYKTTDAGAHWFAMNNGLPGDGHPIVDSLVMDPQDPSTLYAGISVRTTFEPDGLGVFKTTDGGNTWTAATEGLGSRYTFALAIDPQTPTTVYAIAGGSFYSCCTGLLYKTTDGGGSWVVLNDFQTNVILVDPQTPSTLYASGGSGLRKSTDGGATWSDTGLCRGANNRSSDNSPNPSYPHEISTYREAASSTRSRFGYSRVSAATSTWSASSP